MDPADKKNTLLSVPIFELGCLYRTEGNDNYGLLGNNHGIKPLFCSKT